MSDEQKDILDSLKKATAMLDSESERAQRAREWNEESMEQQRRHWARLEEEHTRRMKDYKTAAASRMVYNDALLRQSAALEIQANALARIASALERGK